MCGYLPIAHCVGLQPSTFGILMIYNLNELLSNAYVLIEILLLLLCCYK